MGPDLICACVFELILALFDELSAFGAQIGRSAFSAAVCVLVRCKAWANWRIDANCGASISVENIGNAKPDTQSSMRYVIRLRPPQSFGGRWE